ncbi:FHA domain-containing protein [Roseiconus lacunae]|uniref:FHA domain-containing protein n=1 Tax=Roseiconus lacunae TaxID=2605694 RepID=UPI00308CD530|nr:FHA domain-containing protein [Stieleria sp. HD01]
MPVCQQCKALLAPDGICSVCRGAEAQFTQLDPVVHRLSPGDAPPLRPVGRILVPRLILIDDDSDIEGEVQRLRRTRTTIGRHGCDINLSNDADVSSLHAIIERDCDQSGRTRWHLSDQESTNGTFERIEEHGCGLTNEFLMGWTRIQIVSSESGDAADRLSIFVGGSRVDLKRSKSPITIGRDAKCDVTVNDPYADRRHAEIRLVRKRWMFCDQDSRNGLWVRQKGFLLKDASCFLIGGQRFRFEIPAAEAIG